MKYKASCFKCREWGGGFVWVEWMSPVGKNRKEQVSPPGTEGKRAHHGHVRAEAPRM